MDTPTIDKGISYTLAMYTLAKSSSFWNHTLYLTVQLSNKEFLQWVAQAEVNAKKGFPEYQQLVSEVIRQRIKG